MFCFNKISGKVDKFARFFASVTLSDKFLTLNLENPTTRTVFRCSLSVEWFRYLCSWIEHFITFLLLLYNFLAYFFVWKIHEIHETFDFHFHFHRTAFVNLEVARENDFFLFFFYPSNSIPPPFALIVDWLVGRQQEEKKKHSKFIDCSRLSCRHNRKL